MSTPPQPAPPRSYAWAVLTALAVLALISLVMTPALLRRDKTPGSPPATTPTVTMTVVPTETPTAQPTAPTAEPDLAAFFLAARHLDRQLHKAAAAINQSGPPWTTVSPSVAATVTAADLRPVARTIPAGLPQSLRASVILVYSDLASRRYALGSFDWAGPLEGQTTASLRRELANGHPAAARFERDLTSARAQARSTAPIPSVAASSRRTAELLLLVRYVDAANGGCGSRGGTVVSSLPPISWQSEDTAPPRDGTIAGIGFTATLGPAGNWTVNLYAC